MLPLSLPIAKIAEVWRYLQAMRLNCGNPFAEKVIKEKLSFRLAAGRPLKGIVSPVQNTSIFRLIPFALIV